MSYRMGAYILAAAPGERMCYQAKDITEEEATMLTRQLAGQMGHKAFGLISPERSVGQLNGNQKAQDVPSGGVG